MDAQLTFYRHNKLALRFLLFATLIFVLVLSLVWWQERSRVVVVDESPLSVRTFSSVLKDTEITQAYMYDAAYLHDIEAYPDIARTFLQKGTTPLRDDTLEEALAAVLAATAYATATTEATVYDTSQYVGNFRLVSGVSLYELLLQRSGPYTKQLLETALADLRAGVIKIQKFHDVAPPTVYRDGVVNPVFFPTPSYPSLTVSEVALTARLMAMVDPRNARMYELSALWYAGEVFASGAHFKADIDAGLTVAAQYTRLMEEVSEYDELLRRAAEESNLTMVESSDGDVALLHPLAFKTVPFDGVQIEDAIESINYGYEPRYDAEEIAGVITATLLDDRLVAQQIRPYTITLRDTSVLPIVMDKTERTTIEQASGVAWYTPVDSRSAVYVSGTGSLPRRGYFLPGSEVLMYTHENTLRKITLPNDSLDDKSSPQITSLAFHQPSSQYVVSVKESSETPYLVAGNIQDEQVPEQFAAGASPTFINDTEVLYVHKGQVFVGNLKTKSKTPLSGLSTARPGSDYTLRYDADAELLLVTEVTTTLVPESTVTFYSLQREGAILVPTKRYQVTFLDRVVHDVVLSPQGHYVALAVTKTTSIRDGSILIFEINSGIIKKEIDLKAFNPEITTFGSWLPN
jgi:hypothetical protein